MTKIVAAAGLAALWLAGAPALAQSPPAPGGVLTVRGAATVEQRPDLAHLTVSVVTSGPTPDGVARDHAARVARAAVTLAQVKAQGASVDQGSYGLAEERDPEPDGGKTMRPAITYRAETRYDVTVSPIDGLDAIVAAIAATGLFDIGPASYAVADETEVLDRVRRAAMADALHQAQVYADAGGVRLDAIDRIADGEASGSGGPVMMALKRARAPSVGIVPPKTLTFQGGIIVTWRIAPR